MVYLQVNISLRISGGSSCRGSAEAWSSTLIPLTSLEEAIKIGKALKGDSEGALLPYQVYCKETNNVLHTF